MSDGCPDVVIVDLSPTRVVNVPVDTPPSTGTGDVTGPSSAIDENIAVFDGATGKLIKDGLKKISDLLLLAGGTMLGNLGLKEVTETVYTMPDAQVRAFNGTMQKRTLAGNETLTFVLSIGQSVYVTVIPGANTLGLSNVIEWIGGVAPTTIEAEHAFVFWNDDGIITGNSLGGIA